MEAVKISVIICTYNPPEDVFSKCLNSIYNANALFPPHEVLIIDNNSSEPLVNASYVKGFLQQHAFAKVMVETSQGLTPARLRGIKESSGDLLIFIDDDNFIDDNYFQAAAVIRNTHPFIGAYSGQVSLVYDREPESWTKRYWGMLIHRKLSKDLWSNQLFNNDTMPNGAGMCVTRDTADHYVTLFETGKRSFNLDRSKQSLLSGGDNDLAMCACDIGKGMGLFKDLHLQHYIPAKRFTLAYLAKLTYGIYYSYVILLYMREGRIYETTFLNRLKTLVQINMMKRNDRIIQRASRKGLEDGIRYVQTHMIHDQKSH